MSFSRKMSQSKRHLTVTWKKIKLRICKCSGVSAVQPHATRVTMTVSQYAFFSRSSCFRSTSSIIQPILKNTRTENPRKFPDVFLISLHVQTRLKSHKSLRRIHPSSFFQGLHENTSPKKQPLKTLLLFTL